MAETERGRIVGGEFRSAARGYFNGQCRQEGCETTGVGGIPAAVIPNVEGDPNGQHRCNRCGDDIHLLTAEGWTGEHAARAREVLGMPVDQLRGEAERMRAGVSPRR